MRRALILSLSLSCLPAAAVAADAAPPAAATAAPSPADAIVGRWKPDDGDAVVSIAQGPGGYAGVIVESPKKPEMAGKPMFRGLVYDAKKAQWTGEVFAVKKGEFVPAVVKLSDEGFVLTAGKGFMSKKIKWTRA